MLKETWKTRSYIGGFALVLFACVFLITLSPSYKSCVKAQEGEQTNQQADGFFPRVGTLVICETDTLNENTGALTGLGTLAVAFFTLTLWLVTNSAVRLAREEFISTFRPHLIVRNVHALESGPDDEMAIMFELINNGTSPARIVASAFEVNSVNAGSTFRNLHLPKVGEPPDNWIGEKTLIPSQVYRGTFKPGRMWRAHHFHDSGCIENGFFWGGKILYQDRMGNQRRLGVYRRFDVTSRRFRPVNDPEFEYDD